MILSVKFVLRGTSGSAFQNETKKKKKNQETEFGLLALVEIVEFLMTSSFRKSPADFTIFVLYVSLVTFRQFVENKVGTVKVLI